MVLIRIDRIFAVSPEQHSEEENHHIFGVEETSPVLELLTEAIRNGDLNQMQTLLATPGPSFDVNHLMNSPSEHHPAYEYALIHVLANRRNYAFSDDLRELRHSFDSMTEGEAKETLRSRILVMRLQRNDFEARALILLVKAGVDLNKLGGVEYYSPLYYAFKGGNIELAQRLLEFGANPHIGKVVAFDGSSSPMKWASRFSFDQLSQKLIHADVMLIRFGFEIESMLQDEFDGSFYQRLEYALQIWLGPYHRLLAAQMALRRIGYPLSVGIWSDMAPYLGVNIHGQKLRHFLKLSRFIIGWKVNEKERKRKEKKKDRDHSKFSEHDWKATGLKDLAFDDAFDSSLHQWFSHYMPVM